MDLKHLESFIRIVEFGSLTKAAAILNVSQSLLSRQMRQLEAELGAHLLERNGRGVEPTDAGRRLLEHGKGILRQVEVARQQLGEREGAPAGKVVVGLPPSVGRLLAVDLVIAFRERYPAASISVVEGLSASMQEWLLLGRLDFALLYNPALNAQLHYRYLWAESLYLIGAEHPQRPLPASVALGALGQYPLIIPSHAHSVRQLVEADAARHGVALDIVLEIDSIPALLDLVERGLGYGVLSRNAILGRATGHPLRAVPIVEPNITSRLVVATSAQRPIGTLAEHTIALIRRAVERGVLDPLGAARGHANHA